MDVDLASLSGPTFPTPLISPLCAIIYSLSLPLAPETTTLDPRPPPSSEVVARELLLNLALVNKEFYHTARPWLWRSLIIARPRGWIGIVEKIGGKEAEKDWAAELAQTGAGSPTGSGSPDYTPRRSRSISQNRREGSSSSTLSGSGGGGSGAVEQSFEGLGIQGGRRSQSIERSTVFVEAQMSALKRSTSLGSQHTPSHEEETDQISALGEMLLTPPGSRETSPTRRMSGMGPDGGASSLRGRSSERVGRSRSRVRLMGVGMRDSSIHSILEGVPITTAPHPSTMSPMAICYPTSLPSSPTGSPTLGTIELSSVASSSARSSIHAGDEEEEFDEADFYEDLNEAGLPTRLLSFCNFRTTGLRRSLEEGIHGKYITPDRLGLVLGALGNLKYFGATEYMDSALTLPNLISLLLRGSPTLPSLLTKNTTEWSHLPKFRPLAALDLCGVNSRAFTKAVSDFVVTFLNPHSPDREGGEQDVKFEGMRRLGLHFCKLPSADLEVLLGAFTGLAHVDLGYTRLTGGGLRVMTEWRLVSLSLSRTKVEGCELTEFLLHEARSELRELNLYGSRSFPSSLSSSDLTTILLKSPAFTSGKLRYLDISSAPLTPAHLDIFPAQPDLISLGLAHMPLLPLRPLATFLAEKASNVEILALTYSSPEIVRAQNQASAMVALHALLINPLCSSPLTFDLSPPLPPRTHLRVVELGPSVLLSLSKGHNTTWRVIKSAGARGWYVDVSSGWSTTPRPTRTAFAIQAKAAPAPLSRWGARGGGWGPATPTSEFPPVLGMGGSGEKGAGEEEDDGVVFRRGVGGEDRQRRHLEYLADSAGKVGSGVGWGSRKLEILRGEGLLGREEGLYGGFSFSFDE